MEPLKSVNSDYLSSSGRASLLADLDEEIDFLQSIMEKQTVTEIKPAESPGEAHSGVKTQQL